MDKVACLDLESRRQLFTETANRLDLLPGLVEKDFWVCWILKHLFSTPEFMGHILFKGGTTLSKIFNLIHRFSEDIDLAVDWEMLGFTGDRSPLAKMSKTKRTKLLEEMLGSCRAYVSGAFLQKLRGQIARVLGEPGEWNLAVDPDKADCVNFTYARAADVVAYLSPQVTLELGTHAEFMPNGHYNMLPYAAQQFPQVFGSKECPVQAIKAERTFWEKATILHQEHFRTANHEAPARYSRHYYDVYMMSLDAQISLGALSNPDLLKRVVEHKVRFYPRQWARYDLAVPETLELGPSDAWTAYLRDDYRDMQVMMFGKAPSFDEILDGLRALTDRIRAMPASRS